MATLLADRKAPRLAAVGRGWIRVDDANRSKRRKPPQTAANRRQLGRLLARVCCGFADLTLKSDLKPEKMPRSTGSNVVG
jgi:hypothetical protein